MTTHALLLAHGSGGGIESHFGPIRAALTGSGRRVVGFDLPGTGDAPRATAPLDLDALADGLVAEADAAGVGRFAVAGYSLGTTIAVRAATRHPERVTGLVLTAPSPGPTTHCARPRTCGGTSPRAGSTSWWPGSWCRSCSARPCSLR